MPRTPSHAASIVGAQIRAVRNERKMTQDQLAVGSGIDSANIRSFESGRALPSLQSLVRVADALGCPTSALIDDLAPGHFERNET